MRAGGRVLACVALWGCVTSGAGNQTDLPPGYPPKIGAVVADLNGVGQHWDVYDYSIGALDAAAQIIDYDGVIQFRLLGQPAGDPDVENNRLTLKGTLPGKLSTGPLAGALIEVIAGKDWTGLRLSSSGQAVAVVLDEVTDRGPGGYGHAKGHFRAVVCSANGVPVRVDRKLCQPISGSFDTDLQFSKL